MTDLSYHAAPVPIREDLEASHQRAWDRLAAPGTWLTGEHRIAIAAETRNAPGCSLCKKQKEALSPFAVDGTHESQGELPPEIIEIIHRIVADPGRLAEPWFLKVMESGVAETDYVETVAVIVTTIAIDTFNRAVGMKPPALPYPHPGEPSQTLPEGLTPDLAWVRTIDPDKSGPTEADYFAGGAGAAHIRRALTLVPAEARGFFDVLNAQYLSGPQMRDFSQEFRAITHAQIELVAGRISALNQCVY
jgi:hypothetical protein